MPELYAPLFQNLIGPLFGAWFLALLAISISAWLSRLIKAIGSAI